MPYRVEKSGDCPDSHPWAVVKATDGEVMGCHASKADAEKQQAALYAAEGGKDVKTAHSTRLRPVAFQRPQQARIGRWYEIKNLAAETASIAIYDEIGMWGVTASDFVNELKGITARTISLSINSPGGDVFDGLAILNSLRQHPAAVNVVIDGVAASAASFIAMAGDSVKIAPQAMMMIHDASGLVVGNSRDMEEMAALLDKTSDNIASVYAQRAGGTQAEWRAAMKAETWYTDQEAVEAGLADEILSEDAPAEKPKKATNQTESRPRAFDFDVLSAVKEALK